MVVYADVLFFLNSVIDYFLIGITAVVTRVKIKTIRQILASLLGGVFSFYIFVDAQNFVVDILFRLLTTGIITLCAFGFNHLKYYIKTVVVYFISSIFLFGLTFLFYRFFHLKKIIINNTYFYFNFSPILAISMTAVTYFAIKLVHRFSNRKLIKKECELELNIGNNFISAKAYIDTGNLAKDYFSDSELCFVSKEFFENFTGCNSVNDIMKINEYQSRYRTIPVTTLNETSLLNGLRCDGGKIYVDKNVYFLYKPIIVISNNLPDGFDVIISAKALDKTPENVIKGDKVETI